MKKYYFGWTGRDCWENSGTEKAWLVTLVGGATTVHDRPLYIPRSICICEEPNEYGNMRVFIPVWFFKKNCFKSYPAIREIEWGENGVSPLIER